MKNITLSAEASMIERARDEARRRKTTLNQMFRDWLEELTQRESRSRQAEVFALLQQMRGSLQFDQKFSREEMNER